MKPTIMLVLFCSIMICAACSAGKSANTAASLEVAASQTPVAQQLSSAFEAGLPMLSELPAVERSASAGMADYFRKGSELATPGDKANAITLGDSLIMGPNWDPAAQPPSLETSWGIYGYHLPGYDRAPQLDLSWASRPDASQYYVAVSDFGSNRWRWLLGNETDSFDFGSLDGYFSNLDTIYFAVLLTGTGSFELSQLRLGGNFAPTASFTVNQDSGQYMFITGFDGSASSDPDGSIAEYHWSFEDPVYFNPGDLGPTPSHKYDHVGTFTCTLRVVDNEGDTGEATATINVTGEPGNQAPTAVIFADKTGGPLPQGINFDAFGCTDPDDIVSAYRWDLDGDGYYEFQSAIPVAYAEYTKAGSYTVGLMAIDFFGAWDKGTTEITITPITGENPPTAALSVDYYCLLNGVNRIIDTSGVTDPDNDIVKYEWDFEGDGTFDYDNGLYSGGDITYTLPGSFTPAIRVTDSGGRQATASLQVIVSNGTDPQESEPNGSTGSANSLGGFLNYAKYISDWGGELGGSDTADWYEISCDRETDASFWVDFSSLVVDLGIALYSAEDLLAPLVDADFGGDREYFHYHIPAPGTYYLKVFVPQGAVETGPGSYMLTAIENHLPVADLQGSPTVGFIPFDINFDATGSTDADGSIVNYDYDLDGDGSFEILDTFDPNYVGTINQLGTFNVAVRVWDELGESSIAFLSVTGGSV